MSNIELTKDDFPLVWLNKKEASVGAFKNFEDLTSCSRGVVKPGGFYENLRLFSITGKEFIVKAARIRAGMQSKTIGNLLWRLVNADIVKVDLDIIYQGFPDIESVKLKMISLLTKNYTRWDGDGNFERLIEMLNQAQSVEDLVVIMKKRYFYELF